jgi:tetratricopeptide (TPR) repeat protein
LNPENVDAMLGLAHVAAQQNNLMEAENWLGKALAINPQSAAVQVSLARYLISAKRFSEAEAALKKAVAIDPKALTPRLSLGDLYSGWLKNAKAAADAYREATRIEPRHAGAHYGLGMSLLAVARFSESETALKKALALTATDNPLPQLGLGRLYLAQGKHAEAIRSFDGVLSTHKNLAPALIGRGDVYFAQHEFQAAAKEYQSVTLTDPNNTEAHLKLGMSLQALKENAAAEKSYLAATRLEPRLALAYNNLAWMSAPDPARIGQAIEWAEKAVSLAPDSAEFHDTLGWSYYLAGRTSEARVTLEKALAKNPAAAEIHYHLGMVLMSMKKTQEAKSAFRKALSIQKNHVGAKAALAKAP